MNEAKGKINLIKEVQTGTSKTGSEWSKLEFTIDTGAEWDNILCFELFGQDRVNDFNQTNKVGQTVNVNFNIKCNAWNDKHFTSLSCWKIEVLENEAQSSEVETKEKTNDLPF